VDGKGYFIQIILELKSRGLNELLVFWIVRDIRQLCGNLCPSQVLQVDVNEAIGLRQQTGRLWWSMLAQENYYGNRDGDHQDAGEDGEFASKSHLVVFLCGLRS
jgi:hypothetical protein